MCFIDNNNIMYAKAADIKHSLSLARNVVACFPQMALGTNINAAYIFSAEQLLVCTCRAQITVFNKNRSHSNADIKPLIVNCTRCCLNYSTVTYKKSRRVL